MHLSHAAPAGIKLWQHAAQTLHAGAEPGSAQTCAAGAGGAGGVGGEGGGGPPPPHHMALPPELHAPMHLASVLQPGLVLQMPHLQRQHTASMDEPQTTDQGAAFSMLREWAPPRTTHPRAGWRVITHDDTTTTK